MGLIVFQIFSGTENSIIRNTGGVETYLNQLLNVHYASAVIGRRYLFLPVNICSTNVGIPISNSKTAPILSSAPTNFPYIAYLFSNLILGLITSALIRFYSFGSKNDVVVHFHDPIIGAGFFLSGGTKIGKCISQFHSEYSKRLRIMLKDDFISKFTLNLFCFFEKVCIKNSIKIIAVNKNVKEYILSTRCVTDEKIVKIPIFLEPFNKKLVSFNRKDFKKTLDLSKAEFIITYVGRLSREKNLTVLLKAFSSLHSAIQASVTLLIVGEGEEMQELKSHVGTSAVLFLGHRSRLNVEMILEISDLFILPSLTEGFPFSLLEAMQHGKPIIASSIKPVEEIVTNRYDAMLFDPVNSDQLQSLILELYSNSKLRQVLGENAMETAKKYNQSNVLPQIKQLYSVLHKH